MCGLHLTGTARASLVLVGCLCSLNSAMISLLGEKGHFLVTAGCRKGQVIECYSYLQHFYCNCAAFGFCAYGSVCFSLCSSLRPGTNITLKATLFLEKELVLSSCAPDCDLKFIALNWKWHIQCCNKTVNLQKPGVKDERTPGQNPALVERGGYCVTETSLQWDYTLPDCSVVWGVGCSN